MLIKTCVVLIARMETVIGHLKVSPHFKILTLDLVMQSRQCSSRTHFCRVLSLDNLMCVTVAG